MAPRPEDAAQVAALLAGDEAAFRELVGRLHGGLTRVALAHVSSRAVADEVVQETWMAVLTGLKNFEGRSSLKSWVYRILVNRARTRGTREARSVPFSALGPAGDDGPAVDPANFKQDGHWRQAPQQLDVDSPLDKALRKEAVAVVNATVELLPEQQRLVITLRDIQGLDAAEVCDVLEISEANQRVLLHRARARVRAALEQSSKGRQP